VQWLRESKRKAIMKIFLPVIAILLIILGLAGIQGNIRFMMKGQGLPAEPARRQGFIVGMFALPTLLLVGGVACGALALRERRR
jgi:hypothetical protein